MLPFEKSTARIFGMVVGDLEKQGLPISDMDALIASVALEHDELLVTRNVRHFERVRGLRVESYAQPFTEFWIDLGGFGQFRACCRPSWRVAGGNRDVRGVQSWKRSLLRWRRGWLRWRQS
jgi:hypothetical protein